MSCSNSQLFNSTQDSNISPEQGYIDLQIKLHTAYSLMKSLSSGVINQEEYDKLKLKLFSN
tara:strand:- start:367 stop:549 length:183 start_codon:yes stop_codon:yes gene_type:complete